MLLKQPYLKYIWVGSCSVISGVARVSGARGQGIKIVVFSFAFLRPKAWRPGADAPPCLPSPRH